MRPNLKDLIPEGVPWKPICGVAFTFSVLLGLGVAAQKLNSALSQNGSSQFTKAVLAECQNSSSILSKEQLAYVIGLPERGTDEATVLNTLGNPACTLPSVSFRESVETKRVGYKLNAEWLLLLTFEEGNYVTYDIAVIPN